MDYLGKLVDRQRLAEGAAVSGIDVVLASIEAHANRGVDVRNAHVGSQQAGLEPEGAEQRDQERIAGVAGTAEVVMLDAVQVLVEGGYAAAAFAANQHQLRDVLERNAADLLEDDFAQVLQ